MRRRDQIVEFRNYRTQPGQRDALIDLFEREFIEPQEALGAYVLASFRNLDNPDRFVWLRGFADFDARFSALDGFYTGEVWKGRRAQANAAMIDSDDVLLLRPIEGGVARDPAGRSPIGAAAPDAVIAASLYFPARHGEESFAAFFSHDLAPVLKETGADHLATFVTEHSPNNYPRLPVRENETVLVVLTRFASSAEYRAHLAALGEHVEWRALEPALNRSLRAPTQTFRLQPTPRSLLR